MATFTANMAKLTAGDLTMMDKNMFPKIGPTDIRYQVYKERDFVDIEKRLAALEIEIVRFTTGAMMAPDLGARLIAPR
jgi:hypothetical protein